MDKSKAVFFFFLWMLKWGWGFPSQALASGLYVDERVSAKVVTVLFYSQHLSQTKT